MRQLFNTFWISASVGVDAMRVNPQRTTLSMLDVVIGVGSLVCELCLGDGMECAARTQIEQVTDVQTVSVVALISERVDGQLIPVRDYPVFSRADAAAAMSIPLAREVTIQINGVAVVDLPATGKRRQSRITGPLAQSDRFLHLQLAGRRFFTDAEASRGARVAGQLLALHAHDCGARPCAGRPRVRHSSRAGRFPPQFDRRHPPRVAKRR